MNKLFILFFALTLSIFANATNWDVSILFINSKNLDLEADIQQNINEITQNSSSERIRINYLNINDLGSLISRSHLKDKLTSFFSNPKANRLLFVYGHGKAYDGLENINPIELNDIFASNIPDRENKKPLDILWFDSCYMANIETIYQLKNLTSFYVGSQDSEFSSGMPFDILSNILQKNSDPRFVAMELAYRFLESYSFIKQGSQTSSVQKSSATISVIDLNKINNLISLLSDLNLEIKSLPTSLLQKYSLQYIMDDPKVIDLGHFSKKMKTTTASKISKLLEVPSSKKSHTNPRVLLQAPIQGARLVFGYENWTRGDLTDPFEENSDLHLSHHITYLPDQNQKSWPSRIVNKKIFVTPFRPGINTFNYLFLDPKTNQLLKSSSVVRSIDFWTKKSTKPSNPIIFTGYTQGLGSSAEKYSGLNISNPLNQTPHFDYVNLDFFTETKWGQ